MRILKSTDLMIVGVIVLFTVGILVSSSYAKIDQETIVGVWLFDEGSGKDPEDSSKSKNDGIFFGDPEWVDGKFGGALEFDGDDRVIVPSSDSIESTMGGLTVVFWLYPTEEATNGNVLEVNGNSGWRIRVFSGGRVHFFDRGATNAFSAGTTPPIGKWSHIAATGSKDGITIYINGKSVGSKNVPYAPVPGKDNLSIGGTIKFLNPEHFVGRVDEVGIFNVALGEGDINSIMTGGLEVTLFGGAAVLSTDGLAVTWGGIKAQD